MYLTYIKLFAIKANANLIKQNLHHLRKNRLVNAQRLLKLASISFIEFKYCYRFGDNCESLINTITVFCLSVCHRLFSQNLPTEPKNFKLGTDVELGGPITGVVNKRILHPTVKTNSEDLRAF